MVTSLTLRWPGPAPASSAPSRPEPGRRARVHLADVPNGLPSPELVHVVAGRIRRNARGAADRVSATEA